MPAPVNDVLTADLDPASDRPVFRQISDHLREAITLGSAGRRRPAAVRVAADRPLRRHPHDGSSGAGGAQGRGPGGSRARRGVFVRARPTVRRLGSDRFARHHREQGKAAFIAEVEGVGSTPTVDRIEVTEELPPPDIATRPGAQPSVEDVVRRRRYLSTATRSRLATSYIPATLAEGTAIVEPNTGPGGIYARLEEQGHRLSLHRRDQRPDAAARRGARAVAGVGRARAPSRPHGVRHRRAAGRGVRHRDVVGRVRPGLRAPPRSRSAVP